MGQAQARRSGAVSTVDTLHVRLGARPAVDAEMLARAEAALRALSSQFDGWMAEEVARLNAAYVRLCAEPDSPAAWDALHVCVHDLKGLGATYGHPFATRVCASLCRLLDDPALRDTTPLALAQAHITGVDTVVRDDLRDPADPSGLALCEGLEAQASAELALRAHRTGRSTS